MRAEVQKRLPKEWSEEEIVQLTELWTQLKDDDGNFKNLFSLFLVLFFHSFLLDICMYICDFLIFLKPFSFFNMNLVAQSSKFSPLNYLMCARDELMSIVTINSSRF